MHLESSTGGHSKLIYMVMSVFPKKSSRKSCFIATMFNYLLFSNTFCKTFTWLETWFNLKPEFTWVKRDLECWTMCASLQANNTVNLMRKLSDLVCCSHLTYSKLNYLLCCNSCFAVTAKVLFFLHLKPFRFFFYQTYHFASGLHQSN